MLSLFCIDICYFRLTTRKICYYLISRNHIDHTSPQELLTSFLTMNKHSASTQILLILYPYPMSEFHYNLYELNNFSPYCDVVVWDIPRLANPKFASALDYARATRSNIVSISTWTQFFRCVADLKQLYLTHALTIRTFPATNASQFLVATILYYSFRKSPVKFFDVINGGLPVLTATSADNSPHKAPSTPLIARLKAFVQHISSLQELNTRIAHTIFRTLSRYTGALTHRLVAGQHYLSEALRGKTQGTTLLFGHSDDHSNYLRTSPGNKEKITHSQKFVVLLDAPGPAFTDDYAHLGRKPPNTVAIWYPVLAKFFDRLEADTGVSVKIAGHYKSTHPPIAACFGNRAVHYGRTLELVRDCEFVITRCSTAVSYAVAFRKPVMFIYSDEIAADGLSMLWTLHQASWLGTTPINIDSPPTNFTSLLQVNESKYKAYETACLTSGTTSRPNYQIILEDVMGITTISGPDAART